MDAIETVAASIVDGLGEVADATPRSAPLIETALGGLSDRLDEVDFEAVQAAIAGGLGQVASKLASAQLTPYFDAANDIIDTTADVISAVWAVAHRCAARDRRPLTTGEADRFRRHRRQSSRRAAGDPHLARHRRTRRGRRWYQAVIAFLESIDPGAAIAEFEPDRSPSCGRPSTASTQRRARRGRRHARARALAARRHRPARRGAVAGRRAVRRDPRRPRRTRPRRPAPTTDGGSRRAPPTDRGHDPPDDVGDLARTQPRSSGRVPRTPRPGRVGRCGNRRGHRRIRTDRPDGPGLVGTVVGALAEATGLPAEASCWPAVRRWFGEIDGRADVSARLSAAAGELDDPRRRAWPRPRTRGQRRPGVPPSIADVAARTARRRPAAPGR